MATTKGVERCKYCGRASTDAHNKACPIEIGTPEAMAEWNRGDKHGFHHGEDGFETIQPWQYRYYPKTYILGYVTGEEEIEILIDDAAQRRYFE